MNTAQAVLALGLLALVVGFVMPTFITTPDSNSTETIELDEDTERNLTERLSINATYINSTSEEATFVVKNLQNYSTNQTSVNQTTLTNSTVLNGDTITVQLQNFRSNSSVLAQVTYPPMFGWAGGARGLMGKLPLVIALLGALMVFAGIGKSIL